MPTSAPGNKPDAGPGPRPRHAAGFTLIELLLVVALIAVASAVATLALRDPAATRLQREGQRLAMLLDAARNQSRALGVAVRWRPVSDPRERVDAQGRRVDFRFDGLPPQADVPQHWLSSPEDGQPQVLLPPQRPMLVLGPEPMIDPQRVVLRLGDQQAVLQTDGVGPFVLEMP
jgi:general secretion pathway protein H